MLHPVGPLPAAVYWRRRVLVLTLLVSVLGGSGWVGHALATGRFDAATTTASSTRPAPAGTAAPALERVVPSVAGVRLPEATAAPADAPPPAAPVPAPGGPCSDAMIAVEVRTPGTAPAGAQTTLELAVVNTSGVPCVRALDKQLQELVLLDAAGARLWGSNDCVPETSSDLRTLAPGEVVTFPVVWTGLTSEPACAAPRVPPPPGSYVVRGRLDTAVSPDAILQLS
ncbi:MucR family transcriptional regulator [Geodermatophilus sp. SYSU D00815]